ncbi:MAG TPA: hypothetical protein VF017_15880 [Thermoanaerobaculia bacterium]|nr:hypothetical protein [Thermoanaerobaculia bacterium]
MRTDFEPAELMRLRAALDAVGSERPHPRLCPHPRRLWQAAHRQIGGASLRRVVDHVIECPACARDWRAFEAHSRPPVVREPEPLWRRLLQGLRPAVLVPAAALLLLSAGVVFLLQGPLDRGQVERGGELAIESLVPADARLSREDPVLRWKAVPGASSYDLVVATPDLTELLNQRGLTTPEIHLPAAALAGLPAGAEITWQVTAHFADGNLRSSRTFSTRLE